MLCYFFKHKNKQYVDFNFAGSNFNQIKTKNHEQNKIRLKMMKIAREKV